MIEINKGFFGVICAFAIIGVLIMLFITFYVLAGVLHLTYHERHPNDDEKNCPDYVEGNNDDK